MAQQTRDAAGDVVQIVSRTPIMVLAALYQQVDLVIGGDTGPLHLAAAVGTPTCSLYRSSDGLRSGPRGERHAIVQVPMVCSPCFKTSCSDDALCRATLTPDLVFEHLWRHITKNNLIHSKKELA
jgi:heptosyltransferase-1